MRRTATVRTDDGDVELVDCTDASLRAVRETLAEQLQPCVARREPLKAFHFRGVLSSRAFCFIVDNVLSLGTIAELSLTDGILDDERTRILCEGLAIPSVGRALMLLDVSENDMGDDGFEALLLALQRHSRLHTLRAAHNSLSTLAVALLCSMSGSFSSLRELDLSENAITGEAGLNLGVFIARGILHIRRLKLRGCGIAGPGLQALLDARLDELDV